MLGALARLGLGRAYSLQAGIVAAPVSGREKEDQVPGSPPPPDALAQARTAYQVFFAIWKDADPDLPILKQAKAEYERLQVGTAK